MNLDTRQYSLVSDNRQHKLTYTKQRGHHFWLCLACSKVQSQKIPDQAPADYRHNRGNPILGLCARCNHGKGLGVIRYPQYLPRRKEAVIGDGKPIESQIPVFWGTWLEVARRFERKARFEDREDLRHNIIVELALAQRRDGDKPLSTPSLYRIASFVVADYWRAEKRSGLLISLSSPIEDSEGNITELLDTLADDKAIDLDAWVDDRTFLRGCPRRLGEIAKKRVSGIALNKADQEYLRRFWKKSQKRLF